MTAAATHAAADVYCYHNCYSYGTSSEGRLRDGAMFPFGACTANARYATTFHRWMLLHMLLRLQALRFTCLSVLKSSPGATLLLYLHPGTSSPCPVSLSILTAVLNFWMYTFCILSLPAHMCFDCLPKALASGGKSAYLKTRIQCHI